MQSVTNPQRDDRRPQYDIPTTNAPKVISPELKEVLHMLQAFETQAAVAK